jgi:hypothetical protein
MTRTLTVTAILVFGLVAASTRSLRADVKTDEKSLVQFEGMLGRVVGIFGGKAAREGVKSSVAVRGDRMATINDTTGNIVDLKEEKIFELDMKKKTYRVTTFAELRKQIEDAQKKAAEEMKKAQAENKTAQQPPPSNEGTQMEVDFDLKASGQTRMVNGFDTKEFVMTITVREKGKKLEESGGLVLTSNIWEAPRVAAMQEITDFQIRFAKAIASPMIQGASASEMASAMAMYPMMKDAIARARTEAVKMDGTPLLTTTTVEAVQSAEQIAQAQQQQQSGTTGSTPTNTSAAVGSLIGGRMKRGQKPNTAAAAAPGHTTIMTTTSEVLKIATTVVDADLSIPAGFKENK